MSCVCRGLIPVFGTEAAEDMEANARLSASNYRKHGRTIYSPLAVSSNVGMSAANVV